MSSNFHHYAMTYTNVTSSAAKIAMLRPFLEVAERDAPDDQWRQIVAECHASMSDAIAGQQDDALVTAEFPRAAVAVMMQAVGFVDRLITITEEEIARVEGLRDVSGTSGTEDLS